MENLNSVGVVVLNYKEYTQAIECVDSLIRQKIDRKCIVIVDNGSPNDSYEQLFNKYSNVKEVKIIKLEKNLGYAKGMNAGVIYLRNKGFNNILIANSDLNFSNENILKQMLDSIEENTGVVSPIVRNLDGSIEERACHQKKLLLLRIFKSFFVYNKPKKDDDITFKNMNADVVGTTKDRYMLAGSCFLLTHNFFKFYDGLYSKTFLYSEEQATMIMLNRAKLTTKICLTDVVIHKGAASSDNSKKGQFQKESSRQVFKIFFRSKKGINRIIKKDNLMIYEQNKKYFE